ncbi:MaoC/PaaZ C-terminal domain-containing protein [Candidatus Poriferisodalis sp.]|uniref:MaoC/PaaZ C-terminal domain-containing protein n=1 Tax=Candidatus Poriferisodalis sp. TaxID=3101277 RepID=UPI003B521C01
MSNAPRPHGGLWFEELTPGLVIHHRLRRSITEADNVMFTTMTMNPAALHLDFEYARTETQFGKPLVNSMFTAAVVVGISVHETTHGTTVSNAWTSPHRCSVRPRTAPPSPTWVSNAWTSPHRRRHAACRERGRVSPGFEEQA